MLMKPAIAIAGLLGVCAASTGCFPPEPPPRASTANMENAAYAPSAPATTQGSPPPAHPSDVAGPHVYRFDFVLTSNDGSTAAPTTSFTLNLQEGQRGEVVIGKNVPLSAPPAVPGVTAPSPRQDVGLKVSADFRTLGDDVLLEVTTEMSAFEPPSAIRKVVAKGNALASANRPSLVTSLDDDRKHYQLMVTPTKLR
jgi:hypothetical protein